MYLPLLGTEYVLKQATCVKPCLLNRGGHQDWFYCTIRKESPCTEVLRTSFGGKNLQASYGSLRSMESYGGLLLVGTLYNCFELHF